jgi:hypothetical protein
MVSFQNSQKWRETVVVVNNRHEGERERATPGKLLALVSG